jgi:hypothetical protein
MLAGEPSYNAKTKIIADFLNNIWVDLYTSDMKNAEF